MLWASSAIRLLLQTVQAGPGGFVGRVHDDLGQGPDGRGWHGPPLGYEVGGVGADNLHTEHLAAAAVRDNFHLAHDLSHGLGLAQPAELETVQ
jgi:hypothetical protein